MKQIKQTAKNALFNQSSLDSFIYFDMSKKAFDKGQETIGQAYMHAMDTCQQVLAWSKSKEAEDLATAQNELAKYSAWREAFNLMMATEAAS